MSKMREIYEQTKEDCLDSTMSPWEIWCMAWDACEKQYRNAICEAIDDYYEKGRRYDKTINDLRKVIDDG